MGPPMAQMLARMGIEVRLGAAGSARLAVTGLVSTLGLRYDGGASRQLPN
jgi:hypothetical protein